MKMNINNKSIISSIESNLSDNLGSDNIEKVLKPSDLPSPYRSSWVDNPYNFILYKGNYSTVLYGMAHLIGNSQVGTPLGNHRPNEKNEKDEFQPIYLNMIFHPDSLEMEGYAEKVVLDHLKHQHVRKGLDGKIGYKLTQKGAKWAYEQLQKKINK